MHRKLILALTALMVAAVPGVAAASRGDRDNDRLPDRWERKHRLSTSAKSAKADPDRDRLNNLGEYHAKTNPRDADSDEDGVRDGREDSDRDGLRNHDDERYGHHAGDRDDDDDGVGDGDENVGSVVSFANGMLVIKLLNGETVTGKVTAATEVECESRPAATASASSDDDEESGEREESWGREDEDEDEDEDQDEDEDRHGGEDRHGSDDDRTNSRRCGTQALVAGAMVHEAKLQVTSAGTVIHEVELLVA